ncbi:unnamed protein product [Rhodiola kirilowii]
MFCITACNKLSSTISSHNPSLSSSSSSISTSSLLFHHHHRLSLSLSSIPSNSKLKVKCSVSEPLKVMISGAPASGKGTQCELIVKKFGLVHISTGDLLRAEVSAGSEIGLKAKEFMNAGKLVPDEIVTAMVSTRLSEQDAKERGWLLDGYPRSAAQAQSLEKMEVRPDIYILLNVPDEILVDRCVGRRLDPVTGKIYHIKNFPPESEEIRERLVTRPDDTEEKVKSRLEIYKKNVEAILSTYADILNMIDGNRAKEVVFEEISSLLIQAQEAKANRKKIAGEGIPTKLNNILTRGRSEIISTMTLYKLLEEQCKVRILVINEILAGGDHIPELNPEMDVYRIGTLMELVRVIALSFADDGKRVCVQGSMGDGALAGMPLQLAGTRKILEFMDWGEYGAKGTFINIGAIGANEVDEEDDAFILVAPQNAVGNCIIGDLQAMTTAAGKRPVILINPRLQDLPGSSGIMQTMGRDKRLEYAASFEICYFFRLLYYAGTQYPIMGDVTHPYRYELYKRVDDPSGKEKYVIMSTYPKRPSIDEINDAFDGKPRTEEKKATGIWGFLSGIF